VSGPGLPADLVPRPLAVEDAEAVASLIVACDRTYLDWAPAGWETPAEDEELERCRRWLQEPGSWSLGVLDDTEELIGLTMIRPATFEDEAIDGMGHLRALFVRPDRWRQGIATALLKEAEEEMVRRDYGLGMLRTPVGAPARDFYEARGWARVGDDEYLEVIGMRVSRYEKALNVSGERGSPC
jgi:GNAT superfamily N-acetyltransferase